jgi:hypothetical protein
MNNTTVVPTFAARALEALQEISTRKNRVFQGTLDGVDTAVLEFPLQTERDALMNACEYFEAYKRATEESVKKGDKHRELLYSFLSIVCSFWPNYTDRQHPYGPMMQMEGRRTLIPEDLHPEDVDAVAILYSNTARPWLRARLGDLLWVLRRDHTAARDAALNYAKAAEKVAVAERYWTEATTLFLRALQLGVLLGRKVEPFTSVSQTLETVVDHVAQDETTFRAARLMELMLQFGIGEPLRFGQLAEAVAMRLASQRAEPRFQRAYWESAAQWYSRAKQTEAATKAASAVAETYVLEADQALAVPKVYLGSAIHALRNAIQALRQADGDPLRIEELKRRLLEAQKGVASGLQTFTQEVDIQPFVESAQKNVAGKTFWSALIRFAFAHPLLVPAKVRQQMLDSAKEAPLSAMMGTAFLENDGRVKHNTPGLPLSPTLDSEEILQQHTFRHAVRFFWPLRAQGYVEPGRQVIWNEHHPTLDDLEPLVIHNPFIPEGHEPIFLRGLHAGFIGDFMVASLFLVPQIEESIRHVLKQHNVDVSNLMEDETQPVKLLGRLLSLEKTKEIFGENLQFELRGLLIEKAGYEFRNEIAHGFAAAADFRSDVALNIWWLVLQILLRPVLTDADVEAVRREGETAQSAQ